MKKPRRIPSANTLLRGYHFTDTLPIISQELIDDSPGLAEKVKFSKRPSIFGPDLIDVDQLRVCDIGLSPKIEEFVDAVCEVLGGNASSPIRQYFQQYSKFTLTSQKHITTPEQNPPFCVEEISKLWSPKISPGLVSEFGEHVILTATEILKNLPSEAYLGRDLTSHKYCYEERTNSPPGLPAKHRDSETRILGQYSRPGGPFEIDGYYFATTSGHYSMHGTSVNHGLASKKITDNKSTGRIIVGYNVIVPNRYIFT